MIAPMVSVVIPVFNAERFLAQTIVSVLQQTHADFEVLVVDDGSRDASLALAWKYASVDSRVKVLSHPGGQNYGVSATRNLGIRMARGEYIALLDADDLWHPDKLCKQVRVLSQYRDVALVYCKLQTKFVSHAKRFPEVCGTGTPGVQQDIFDRMVKDEVWMPNSSVVFRKAALDSTGVFDEGLTYQVEDHLLFTKITYFFPTYFLDEILGEYVMHPESYTANTRWENSFWEFRMRLLQDRRIGRKGMIVCAMVCGEAKRTYHRVRKVVSSLVS